MVVRYIHSWLTEYSGLHKELCTRTFFEVESSVPTVKVTNHLLCILLTCSTNILKDRIDLLQSIEAYIKACTTGQ